MFEQATQDLNAARKAIHDAVEKSKSPTTVTMGRNAIMFLDTAYMWMSTLGQVIDEQGEVLEGADVKPVDFTKPQV